MRHLPALLDSLAGQEPPFEVLVSDGESGDGTRELAERSGLRVLRGPSGRGGQLRRGAAAARGELLLFLHADARLSRGSLAALRRAFQEPELVAAGLRQRVDHPARFYRWIERAADRRVARGWVYGDSGLAVRRAAYDAVGGFGALAVLEDLDLSRRLRRSGRIALVPGAELTISARRWEREGRLWRTFKNWCLTVAWAAGVDPRRLARYYPPRGPGS